MRSYKELQKNKTIQNITDYTVSGIISMQLFSKRDQQTKESCLLESRDEYVDQENGSEHQVGYSHYSSEDYFRVVVICIIILCKERKKIEDTIIPNH